MTTSLNLDRAKGADTAMAVEADEDLVTASLNDELSATPSSS